MKKLLTWLLVIFLFYYMIRQPQGAGHAVGGVLGFAGQAAKALSTFVSSL